MEDHGFSATCGDWFYEQDWNDAQDYNDEYDRIWRVGFLAGMERCLGWKPSFIE